jgi:hypothetical protein
MSATTAICRTCGFSHPETDCPRWPARGDIAPETLSPYWQQIASGLLAEVNTLPIASDPHAVAVWVGRATSTLAEALRISEANTNA